MKGAAHHGLRYGSSTMCAEAQGGPNRAFACQVCQSTVPAGSFCGNCGAPARALRTGLRSATFAVAPDERVVVPLITSSVFPQLAEKYRTPFRHGLFLLVLMLVAFSMLRLLGPLVIVVALGMPLLFGLYVWRSDAFKDISTIALTISIGVGAVSGAVWLLWTGHAVAAAYDIPLGAAAQLTGVIGFGLVITLAGTVLMLLPAPAVRLLRLNTPESLDGFLLGALGALSYSAAGTIAWLTPQFVAGQLDNYGPWRLLEEASLYGLVDPLTAAAAGGAVGLALWFRPARRDGRQPGHVRILLWLVAAACTMLYLAVYIVDAAELPRDWEMGIDVVITALSMVTARVGVQASLLYEQPDPTSLVPVWCDDCEALVPDMPFCPQCGAAARAMSRSARRERRQAPTATRENVQP